jgi:hypothetical protein
MYLLITSAAPKTGVSAVQISTLSNGVKVVSQDSSCPGATIGVYVAAGSRFESAANAGTAHFIERLAFKGTTNRTAFRLVRDLSRLGSNSRSALTRESIGYVHDGLRSAAPQFVEYAADMARNPQFDLDDVARAKIALDHGSFFYLFSLAIFYYRFFSCVLIGFVLVWFDLPQIWRFVTTTRPRSWTTPSTRPPSLARLWVALCRPAPRPTRPSPWRV